MRWIAHTAVVRATVVAVMALGLSHAARARQRDVVPRRVPATPPPVRRYVVQRAATPLTIDGKLDDSAWIAAAWTEAFTDIEGDQRPTPRLRTRVKLLWNAQFLYVGAELAEPDVWGTITERDAVIFRDNDFEVFLDPDGDTHAYGEVEINALGTVWDLLLNKPYRDAGVPRNAWDIQGLQSAVHVNGSLNHPGDVDEGWTVELALPWASLESITGGAGPPTDGTTWRVNFSRVEWHVNVGDGAYAKQTNSAGQPLAEENWVWSPQDGINMHMPEMWGVVQFSGQPAGTAPAAFQLDPDDQVRWTLRRVYYAERALHDMRRRYTGDIGALHLAAVEGVALGLTPDGYVATAAGTRPRTTWHITQDGRLWRD